LIAATLATTGIGRPAALSRLFATGLAAGKNQIA
jgi:hypothetical protein